MLARTSQFCAHAHLDLQDVQVAAADRRGDQVVAAARMPISCTADQQAVEVHVQAVATCRTRCCQAADVCTRAPTTLLAEVIWSSRNCYLNALLIAAQHTLQSTPDRQ